MLRAFRHCFSAATSRAASLMLSSPAAECVSPGATYGIVYRYLCTRGLLFVRRHGTPEVMQAVRHRSVRVNDVHSRLNPSEARQAVVVSSIGEVRETLNRARTRGWQVAIAGGCHAMGGQQFCD